MTRSRREPSGTRILEQTLDRLGRILLVRPDDAGRAALDPAGAVQARNGRSVLVEDAPLGVRDRAALARRTAPQALRRRGSRRCGRRSRTGSLRARRSRPHEPILDRPARGRLRTISTPSTRSSPRIATGEARNRSRTTRGLPAGSRDANSRRISTFRWTTFDAASSSASLTGSSSSSAGSTTTSAPASSPSSPSSVDVHAAWTGPRRPSTTISRMPDETIASIAASVVSVGASSSPRQREHPRDVEGDVAVPDDDRALVGEVELEVLEVGVAVVPGDELGRRPRSGKVFARNAQSPVGLRADRVDDRVVERRELVVRDVAPDLHVAEEAKARPSGDLLERRETVFSCG